VVGLHVAVRVSDTFSGDNERGPERSCASSLTLMTALARPKSNHAAHS
jgi:hypothetical protein